MLTLADSLFYIVFTGQILLTSWYIPRKILGRMQHVMTTYPPAQYPKLYPKPVEYYQVGQWKFRLICRLIFLLGFVIMFAMLFIVDHATFADDGFISVAWPAGYGIIQFVPLMMLELSEFGQFRLMRKANDSSQRKANLRPRRFFGFVSPQLFAIAATLLVAAVFLDLYVAGFPVEWDRDGAQRALVLVATNGLLAALGGWILHGRNLNPHQSFDDRARQISASLQSFIYVSMAMSVFFMTQAVDDIYPLDLMNAALMSVYFQAIVLLSVGHLLRNIKVDELDFDVYKGNGAATA